MRTLICAKVNVVLKIKKATTINPIRYKEESINVPHRS